MSNSVFIQSLFAYLDSSVQRIDIPRETDYPEGELHENSIRNKLAGRESSGGILSEA